MEIRTLKGNTPVLTGKSEVKEKQTDEPKDGLVGTALSQEPVVTKEMIMSQMKGTEKKSTLAKAHEKGKEVAADWNEKVGGIVGYTAGIGATIPGIYAGVIGGTVAGGIAGLSLGPAAAVLQGTSGVGSFVGTVFSTGGTVAKAAVVAGTACAAVGGFMAGKKLGELIGGAPVAAVGYGAGFVKGLVSKDEPQEASPVKPEDEKPVEAKPKYREKEGPVTKTLEGVAGAVGLITGGLGGAAIGLGVGSGAALTAGVIAENLTLASVGVGGAIGAGVGALLIGGMSAYGGYAAVGGISKGVKWVKNKIMPDKDAIALSQKREDVARKEAEFKQLGSKVDGIAKDVQTFFAEHEKTLDGQQKETKEYIDKKEADLSGKKAEAQKYIDGEQGKLDAREKEVTASNNNIEGIINGKADKIFAEIKKPTDEKYAGLHSQLNKYEGDLKARDQEITKKEKAQTELIEDKTVAAYNEKMKPVTAKYDDLHEKQNVREKGFNDWDKKITDTDKGLDDQIKVDGLKNYEQRKPGLEAEYDRKESDLRDSYKQKTSSADSQHQSEMNILENKERQLRSEEQTLQSQSSSLQSQINNAHSQEQSADYKLRDAENRKEQEVGYARRERDQAVGERDSLKSELNSVNSEINRAQNDRNKFVNQKAQIDGQIPSLRSERDRLKNQLANMHK